MDMIMNENNQLENKTSILTYKNVCGWNSFETALRVSLKLVGLLYMMFSWSFSFGSLIRLNLSELFDLIFNFFARRGGAFVKNLLYFVVPFQNSVNETEAAVFEVIDWIGSNKPIPHTCITLTYNDYSLLVEGLLSRKINVQQHLPSILHEIDDDLVLPNKISNLTKKIKKNT